MPQDDHIYLSIVKQDIVKYDMAIKSLIQEIREHNGSQLELDELSALVRSRITLLREQIEELRRLAVEQDNESDHVLLKDEVSKSDKMLQDNHRSFRNAVLSSQLAINQKSKDELLTSVPLSGEEGSIRKREQINRQAMLKKSSQLTDDLLTVTRLIQDNTEKSTNTLDRLVEGSQTIGSTQEELKTMGSVIAQARKILNKYGRRENTDKLLIFLGLIFFLASCLVVLRNRFIF